MNLTHALKMAARNVFRLGARSLMPLLVVAVASVVIMLIGGLYQYMFDSLELQTIRADGQLWLEKNAGKDANGQLPPLMDARTFTRLSALPGVLVAAPRAQISGITGSGDQSSIFSGTAVDTQAESLLQGFGRPAGPASAVQAPLEGARVGRLLAAGLKLKEGDWLSGLANDQGFSVQAARFVSTEAEEKDRFFLEIPFSALGGVDWAGVDSVHLLLAPGTDVETVSAAITSVFAKTGAREPILQSYRESSGYVSSVRTIYGNNLLFIMIVLAITVFFGIATSFTMSIAERSSELGTLRSFGAPANHITGLFVAEALLMALYGFAAGLVLSLAAGLVINGAGGITIPTPPTASGPLRVSWVFGPQYAAEALGLVLAVALFSSLLATSRLGRLKIIAQLNLND